MIDEQDVENDLTNGIGRCRCEPERGDEPCDACEERSRRYRAWTAVGWIAPGARRCTSEEDYAVTRQHTGIVEMLGHRYEITVVVGLDGPFARLARDGATVASGQPWAIRSALRREVEQAATAIGYALREVL